VNDRDDASHRELAIAHKLVRTRLFFISYVPLWVIFAVQSDSGSARLAFSLLAGWGWVDAFRLIEAGLRRSVRHVKFENISDQSTNVSGYVASYLLPFIGGPPNTLRTSIAYAVYFLVAWAVFVPSDLGLVNPTLYILGWRLIKAERNGHSALIICQDLPMLDSKGEPVAMLMGEAGWVRRPTRPPWTWISRRSSTSLEDISGTYPQEGITNIVKLVGDK
jgi:hypothetical protein